MSRSFEIVLCDLQWQMVKAWEKAFAGTDQVDVILGDLLDVDADAYVSPANSYGHMDGGIDLALRERFLSIESNVRREILKVGPLIPVGMALIVETEDEDVPYLICAPTMEVPSVVSHTENAYHAMPATLNAVEMFNRENEGSITSIAIPGSCTGVGMMHPDVAAEQMKRAYFDWLSSLPAQ